MQTLSIFKISENQRKFDIVELLFDETSNCFVVRWKWTSMTRALEKDFYNIYDAKAKYMERKKFAIVCN